MTARTLPRGRRLGALAGAGVLVAAAAIGGWWLKDGAARAEPESVTVRLPSAEQVALVRATSGDATVAVAATGEDARLINAALPFSRAPVQAARAFTVTGDGSVDQRRALLCLTQAVYYEAGHEPLAGRRAVAQVVLNRMRHPAFPKSVCGVVYQRNATPVCQFTFVCDGSLYRQPQPNAWAEAEKIARAALNGQVEGSVGQATHYHADYVAPRWAPLLAKITKLGAHIFYRWPGSWGLPGAFTGRYIGEPQDPSAMRPAWRPAMRQAVVSTGPAIPAGPPIARAPNDVGGLLDTSKGWTLNIPLPAEIDRKSSAVAARQSAQPVAAPVAVAVAASAVAPAVAAE